MTAAAAPWSPQQALMRNVIGRVATGPEYSKNISFNEARDVMRYILSGEADPVQAGVYLIALRMKRETDEENGGSLQALLDCSTRITANVDRVVDLAEPYDGYLRCTPVTSFLPAVLAACGLPTLSHGLEEVGPKFGVTHRMILRAAGIHVDRNPTEAAQQMENSDIGWCYLDQAQFCRPLHDLVPLRQRIIKRPVLTTVEVLTGPIRGRKSTHLMTGYVHKPYPPVYAQLARQAGFDSAVIVRGVEGGIQPSLNKPGKYFEYKDQNGELIEIDLSPADAGIYQNHRCVPVPDDAQITGGQDHDGAIDLQALAFAAAREGLAALEGADGIASDCLCYAAAVMLRHLGMAESLHQGVQQARTTIKDGRALKCFRAAV